LLRVIQLEPDHEGARGALGYSRYDGEWHTQDEVMTARGYVEYKGRWRLPQEVEILEEQRKVELAEKGWIEKIKRYRNWLDGDRHEEAAKFFREIDDPLAVPGLRRLLETDSIPEVRALVAAPLAQTGAAEAIVALAQRALDDDNEEVRQSCLDQLADGKHPEVVNLFIAKLRDKNNKTINRAAACLRRMNDPIAIVPLVDALVTTHKSIVTSGNPNGYTTSFGSGGSGFSAGSSSKVVSQTIQNPSVLDALVTLAKNVNFNYDVASWKSWLATQRKSKSFDARRG
jgi:hypothetical protein